MTFLTQSIYRTVFTVFAFLVSEKTQTQPTV